MGGKILSDSAFKRTEAAVRFVETMPVDGRPSSPPPPQWAEKKYWAKLVCCGPGGEVEDPDFEDERYWLELGQPIRTDDDPHGFEEFVEEDGRAAIVQATNIAEIHAAYKHMLEIGTIVEARWDPKTQAWWFSL